MFDDLISTAGSICGAALSALLMTAGAQAQGTLSEGEILNTLVGTGQAARAAPDGSVMLVMLPDTGERYLSTFMFEGINEGSDDDWLETL